MACIVVAVTDIVEIAVEEACAEGDEEGDVVEAAAAVVLEERWWEDKTLCDTSRIYPAKNDPMRSVMSAVTLRIWILVGRLCINQVVAEQEGEGLY